MITLNSKPWIFASILYLALPVILWLAGWIQPCFSIPLIALLVTGLCLIYRKLPARQITVPRFSWFASLIIIFLAVSIIGFDGHFQQSSDFFFRNPIYNDLIRYDWPLVFPDGNLFVYYFGFWLPPSLAAKFLPQSWHPYILWIWSLAGMVLFTGSMAIQLKKKILIFTIILFSLSTCSLLIAGAFEVIGIKDEFHIWSTSVDRLKSIHWSYTLSKLAYSFNHFIPSLIFGAIFINKVLDKAGILFTSSLLLICSPFGGLAFLPYLAYTLYHGFRTSSLFSELKTPRALLLLTTSIILVLLIYLFLTGTGINGAGSISTELLFTKRPETLAQPYLLYMGAFLVINLGVPILLLYPEYRKSPIFWITVFGLPIYSLIYMGDKNNELMLKSSDVFFLFLAFFYTQALFRMTGKRRLLLIVYLVLGSLIPARFAFLQLKSFAVSPAAREQNINNEWHGTIYHPDDVEYLKAVKEAGKCNHMLFYSQSGESTRGLMCWASTGKRANEPRLQDSPDPQDS